MGSTQIDDVVKVTASFQWDDTEEFQNVFHVSHKGTAGVSDNLFHAEVEDWLESAYTTLLAYLSTKLDFASITTYNVTQDRPMYQTAWPTLTQGSDAGDPLPTQCAALVSMPTGVKKVVGKKYVPGATETNSISGGSLSAAFKTALANFAAVIIADWVSGVITVRAGTYNTITAVFNDVVSALIDDLFRTQRRRVQGVGQ